MNPFFQVRKKGLSIFREPQASSIESRSSADAAVEEGRKMAGRHGDSSARDTYKKFLREVTRLQVAQMCALRLANDMAERIIEIQRRKEDSGFLPDVRIGDPHLVVFEAQIVSVKKRLVKLAMQRRRRIKELYANKENFV